MMRKLLVLVLLLLSGCALPQPDAERVEQASQVYRWVRDGEVESFAARSTPRLREQLTPALMSGAREYTSSGEPELSRVIRWHSNSVTGGPASYEIVQLHEYPQESVIMQVVMVREASGPWMVDGFHVNSISPAQAAAAGGFSLAGKSPLHYVVLVGVVLAPLICLFTAGIAAWRRRWAWMIFSLFGVGQLVLNWNTGEWSFQALYFSVLGAGFFKGAGPLDPWTLMVSLPLPALLFWVLRRYRPKPAKAGRPPTAPTPPEGS